MDKVPKIETEAEAASIIIDLCREIELLKVTLPNYAPPAYSRAKMFLDRKKEDALRSRVKTAVSSARNFLNSWGGENNITYRLVTEDKIAKDALKDHIDALASAASELQEFLEASNTPVKGTQ